MHPNRAAPEAFTEAVQIRVSGCVQGVGFRPAVWRHARELNLRGEIRNDSEGVLIRAAGPRDAIDRLIGWIAKSPPPLARIESIAELPFYGALPENFSIAESVEALARTQVAPDAAVCAECTAEILRPDARRSHYAFTNCTHCGPRLTIIRKIPYDRANTSMAEFAMCSACLDEYRTPSDRRFHAEAIACPECGPHLELIVPGNEPVLDDPITAVQRLIRDGAIVALKGLGGFHLACDASNATAVNRLRRRKQRDAKPFALMARDIDVVRRYCAVGDSDAALLHSPPAPILLLAAGGESLPEDVAPGLKTLGFMLPYTPLHLLLLRGFATPLVMTSGNLSDEPQAIGNDEAIARLAAIADAFLLHDRRIANRVDDSVVRMMAGSPRMLRRARGYSPAPMKLPPGFGDVPAVLAFGGELKAAFCILQDGQAILSQHQGDLENAKAFDDYCKNFALYRELFGHVTEVLAADLHPEYFASKFARERSREEQLPLIEIQHHHAHIASCLAENAWPLDAPPVMGIALDGLGWGGDGSFWGGEFLLADYRNHTRVGHLLSVAMPGGARAVLEPWRNLYAHLRCSGFGKGDTVTDAFPSLVRKPLELIEQIIERSINAPLASSCGRLFDAVAAALRICCDRQAYEGEAAARLEALATGVEVSETYLFDIVSTDQGLVLNPAPLWREIARDLAAGTQHPVIAAKFHSGLAQAITTMAAQLSARHRFDTVALSGGCFQNRILFERVLSLLQESGLRVLTHSQLPSNDGGLALGQAVIAAARFSTATKNAGSF